MDLFTISDLQRFSGVNVHSIRAWEKRYQALRPSRSEGNTRYYDGNQLRRLLNIASLINTDYKISELCSMPDTRLNEIIKGNLDKEKSTNEYDDFLIHQMISASLTFNESLFNKVFEKGTGLYGIADAYLRLIYPALHRLGLMWSADSIAPAQEHFISNLIRQKLNTATNHLPLNDQSKNHWLLFLPEYEFHESGLLMSNYLIRNSGQRSTYLGANLPFISLREAVKVTNPTALLFFLVSKNDKKGDEEYLSQLHQEFSAQKIYLACSESRIAQLNIPKRISVLKSAPQLENLLKKMS